MLIKYTGNVWLQSIVLCMCSGNVLNIYIYIFFNSKLATKTQICFAVFLKFRSLYCQYLH